LKCIICIFIMCNIICVYGLQAHAMWKHPTEKLLHLNAEVTAAVISRTDSSKQITICPENMSNCSGHGNCTYSNLTNQSSCVCNDGYVKDDCSYKQKSKLSAFMLSLLLGIFGAGRFYLGYYEIGFFKLLLTMMICILPCLPLCCICCIDDNKFGYVYSLVLLSVLCVFLAVWIWWLVDWILILGDAMPDRNGFELQDDL